MVNNAGQRVCHRNHVMRKLDIYIEKKKNGDIRERCKTCRHEDRLRFKVNHPSYFIDKNEQFRKTERYRLKTKADKAEYRRQWLEYFANKYSKNPNCQICQRQLFWQHENHSKRVCLDHRHGDETIIAKSPRTWIQNKPCNANNIRIFESCDFGLLCNNCNAMLPTYDRRAYCAKLINYLETCRK
jgi:hypothetical protein